MKTKLFTKALGATALLAITSLTAFAHPDPRTSARATHAPELVGGPWLNTKDGKPLTLESRKGKVTLVAFWTFGCYNCKNNFAPYARILKKYRSKGIELISVHTPETQTEHKFDEVASHVKSNHIEYPVLIDNSETNWNRWNVNVWPSLYVVDQKGNIYYHWFGELNYNDGGGEAKIGEILDDLLSHN